MSCCGFFSSSIAPSASASRLTVIDNFPSEKIESPAYVPASNKHVFTIEDLTPVASIDSTAIDATLMSTTDLASALATLNGTISYERTETFKFNPDVFPKDFESVYRECCTRAVCEKHHQE
ncbi:hypothetical protein BCR33DRAFT_742303 [Rhizoclosmatium globosum]|uniref:Uncharacterized protein n=1 Tax=Rhizoclosmatium globosum TaxID=329046 RepID=A0A1Y2BR20_9FUNG|nr:hypothetical protein BCR33DRAFT_742303 [Rhizoclosmatium globosum]|eukprot:ORY37199.1 hypothetical protein BCR33DRAFT_742303 [Rhizoclosmatium globosum]